MLFDLLLRELLMLAVMGAAGAGFVATVRCTDTAGSRAALSLGAGLVVLPGLLVLVDFFVPLRYALWFVCVPVCVLSLWWAQRLMPWSRMRPGRRELAAMATVLIAGLAVGNFVLVKRSTLGPTAYGVFDAVGYVSCVDGYVADRDNQPALAVINNGWEANTAQLRSESWGKPWNLELRYCWAYKEQHTASTTIPAVASGAFGWAGSTLIDPFMVVLLLTGAAGTFALARGLGRLGLWPSALAGLLYIGPATYQIYTDGSLGLLAGLAVLPLLVVTLASFLRRPTRRSAILLGACGGAMSAVYPEQLASVLLASGIATVAAVVAWYVRGNRASSAEVKRVGAILGLLVGAGLLVSPRTIPWTYGYLGSQAVGDSKNLIVYPNMTFHYILGWLAQTRAFYDFVFTAPVGAIEVFLGLVVPIVLMGVICFGAIRSASVRILVAFVAAACVQAAVSGFKYHCSYCVQRSLLLTTPVLPVLIVAGFAALAAIRWRWGRDLAFAALGAYLLVVAAAAYSAIHRTVQGSTVSPASMRSIATTIGQKTSGGLALEGFDAEPYSSWLSFPVAYETAAEANPQRISAISSYNDYGGLSYFGVRPFGNPAWNPNYKWVWTRLAGVDQGRRTVKRIGPYAIQQRRYPFDVVIARGVAVAPPSQDPTGQAWIQSPGSQLGLQQGPLTFWIAAASRTTAYLRLQMIGPVNTAVAPRPGLVQEHPSPGILDVCEPIPGPKATRIVSYDISPASGALLGNSNPLNPAPLPATTIRLAAAVASTRPC